jgi:hypothetical protein
MRSLRATQKDHEYGQVYLDALRLQHDCEKAGMRVQAAQAREIRRQAHIRLLALSTSQDSPFGPG